MCNCHVFRDTRRRLIQNTNQQHQSMQTMSCEQSKTEKIRVSDIGITEKSALSSINPRLFLHELSIFPSRRTALTGWNARRFESNPIIQMKVSCCFLSRLTSLVTSESAPSLILKVLLGFHRSFAPSLVPAG